MVRRMNFSARYWSGWLENLIFVPDSCVVGVALRGLVLVSGYYLLIFVSGE